MQEPTKLICPACESGSMQEKRGSKEYSYQGQPFVVHTAYSTCPECGTEVVTPEQARVNDRLIREEHKRIDGLLSAVEIKQFRLKFNLTQHDASFLFGGGLNAFSKYERVEVIQSVAMDRLMRVVDVVPGAFNALVSIAYGAAATVVNAAEPVQHIQASYSPDNFLWGTVNPLSVHEFCTVLSVVKRKSSKETFQVEQYRKVGNG